MFKHILIPGDGSELSSKAVQSISRDDECVRVCLN